MSLSILHNPRCRKSRETLEILQNKGIEPEIILYLQNTPSTEELKLIISKLGISASKLIRRGEPVFKEKYKGKDLTEDEWIEAMISNPKLIERPIVIKDNIAIIGRPPENVISIL